MGLFCLSRSEHIKRFPECGFLKAEKDFTELTVAELYNLEKGRLIIFYVRTECTKLFVSSHLQLLLYFCLMHQYVFLRRIWFVVSRWPVFGRK